MNSDRLPRPEITIKEANDLARDWYDLSGTVRELPGERDRNFHIHTESGEAFVLKIANAAEEISVLEFQNSILGHLGESGLSGFFPQVVQTGSAEKIAIITAQNGSQHLMRLLIYLPGSTVAEVKNRPADLLVSLGRLLGRMDHAFSTFSHDVPKRELHWDLATAYDTIVSLRSNLADDPRVSVIDHFLSLYNDIVRPILSDLRKSVIHNDANDHNVLTGLALNEEAGVQVRRVTGLVDFGDAVYSHTVNELAVALAYVMLDADNPIGDASHVVEGYHNEFALTSAELRALPTLACMRLCLSVSISAWQQTLEPDNKYLSISEAPAWSLLEKLRHADLDLAGFRFRAVCGLEPCPETEAIVDWLKSSRDSLSPIIDREAMRDAAVLDLSFTNPDISPFQNHTAPVALGQYGEVREVQLAGESDIAEDSLMPRRIHLGVDLFTPADTSIYAPLDGVVHSVANDSGDTVTIILKHTVNNDSVVFYTIIANLAGQSVVLKPGRNISAGESLGTVASSMVCNESVPHVHVQLLARLPRSGLLPHGCYCDDKEVWQSMCPDPGLLLGIAPGRSEAKTKNQIIEERKRIIGPSLSISYDQPLKIVRGYMQYLFDQDGRAYLDAVNNVPHVGHCHPRVVEAGQLQMAVLNTNTRYLHDHLTEYAARLTATLPDPLSVCYFVCSGSEANELAIRLARTHTGGTDFIVIEGAYHGNTSSVIDISPYKFDGPGGRGAEPHVQKVPTPDTFRGLYCGDDGDAGAKYAQHVAQATDRITTTNRCLAGFFAEPVMSCAGQIVLPEGYLREAFRHVRQAGGVCIADEVQIGFGRVGTHFWAFETQDVVPDIVTLGKPIGNGHPLAAVVTTPEIARSFSTGMEFFSTFGGNPVSCAIGMAVMDVIEEERLQQNAREVGEYLLSRLKGLKQRYDVIGDVRGLGLFVGIELVEDRSTLAPAAGLAGYVVEEMKDGGVLVSTDGPDVNVIKIKPPIVFNKENADRLVDTLDDILETTC